MNTRKTLTLLTALELQNNEIRDLSPLSGLTALNYLDLRGNPIENEGTVRSAAIETLYMDE